MERKVYVIGHRNPDTDSVVAAAAYANLLRETGTTNCVAARAGLLNPQTEYVFERFSASVPQYLPDLLPRVAYFLSGPADVVDESVPLWEALDSMERCDSKTLAVVGADGRYKSMLHYGAFAQNILKRINPHKKAVIMTSVDHVARAAQAQPVLSFRGGERFRARVVVAALETESFVEHVAAEPAENAVVLVGDRVDVQRRAIEAGIRLLVITNGAMPDREIRELAEARGVSVLSSPYDTGSTAMLVLMSTPVGTMGDESVRPVRVDDLVKRVRRELTQSPSRSLPVVDDEGRVVGLLGEGDLIRDPNVELVLVDHNELSQAVEGAENYRILEVIDHHRLGSFSTRYPIDFINRVVGSTSTIVAGLYRERRVPLTKPIASILLCGILSDTLGLQSATTTDVDRETAEYLANVADLDVQEIARDIMGSASEIGRKGASEIVRLDQKEYDHDGRKFTVSQVEVTATPETLERKEELFDELEALRAAGGFAFSALMVTDVVELTSVLLYTGDDDVAGALEFPRLEKGLYELRGVLSRKKQLMPVLFDAVEHASCK
jgi:manganese-dependent inorganic pyrophosphatase